MKLVVPRERRPHEARVAATPETVGKFIKIGVEVRIEREAGRAANYRDDDYRQAGAEIADDLDALYAGAGVIAKVRRPLEAGEAGEDELSGLPSGAVLLGMLNPLGQPASVEAYAKAGLSAFAMELMPRITRAQNMDVLSSQANLAGYKAVLDACEVFGRALPMMMTAAGTIAPAKVFVMGAGVAGLQAIATARRLGAVVSATDVRPVAKEQVESLGANFVMVEDEESRDAETAGGYAREMSDAYNAKQAALVAETIAKQDIVITTAQIPGRRAPVLIDEAMVASMRPGSVIVDLAVETGGNCALSEAGVDKRVDGVAIVAHPNVASRLAVDASALYARNLFNFLSPMIEAETGTLNVDWEDELVQGTLVARGGEVVHPSLKREAAE